ncbi:MAG: nuclear transport factor 2 family protein [Cytophagales bacterium]|nr:nuclear transport factor 2 family protein [Cytophagales bacterium]
MNLSYTYNTNDHPHEEIVEIKKTVKSHIEWAVNNKDKQTLYSTLVENNELFFFQPNSKDTIIGFNKLRELVEGIFMGDDFKAISVEIKDLRIHISKSLRTAWFSCILNDYNEFQGKPSEWENVRWTGVLEKIKGNWKIFQMHFSKAEDLIK